jgi:glucuronate isomerase
MQDATPFRNRPYDFRADLISRPAEVAVPANFAGWVGFYNKHCKKGSEIQRRHFPIAPNEADMIGDRLARDLYGELCRITLIDPHSHINPLSAASKTLDDILGYHYYTELAHSAGMDKEPLAPDVPPRERVRQLLGWLPHIDNTVQYSWFLDIARSFLGVKGERISADDADALWTAAEKQFAAPDWERQVLKKTNVEKIFLTNDFDDPLEGFDNSVYVPCLRTDDLVFHLDKPAVRERFEKATGEQPKSAWHVRAGVTKLFEHFTRKRAKACAISLPPDFEPTAIGDENLSLAIERLDAGDADAKSVVARGVFWMLAQHCAEFKLPFDLMIGVNRRVYEGGVFQGQDLFDQRTSLIQYAALFNAFPQVKFPISVLTSSQNQELVSYSWIFPNVLTNGHWWYSNTPTFIERDALARLQAAPKTKQLGYYSDAYKLEFILPKFVMYRQILARMLADHFVRPGVYSETQAIAFGRLLLRENSQAIFGV